MSSSTGPDDVTDADVETTHPEDDNPVSHTGDDAPDDDGEA